MNKANARLPQDDYTLYIIHIDIQFFPFQRAVAMVGTLKISEFQNGWHARVRVTLLHARYASRNMSLIRQLSANATLQQ